MSQTIASLIGNQPSVLNGCGNQTGLLISVAGFMAGTTFFLAVLPTCVYLQCLFGDARLLIWRASDPKAGMIGPCSGHVLLLSIGPHMSCHGRETVPTVALFIHVLRVRTNGINHANGMVRRGIELWNLSHGVRLLLKRSRKMVVFPARLKT